MKAQAVSRTTAVAVAIALGAGFASALLSMVTVQKTSLAMALGCISPLPVMLAVLAFGTMPGLAAAVVGAITVGLFDAQPGGLVLLQKDQLGSAAMEVLVYAVSLGVPAWWLARLAAAAPAGIRGTGSRAAAPNGFETRKLGAILASTTAFAVVTVALDFVSLLDGRTSLDQAMATMATRIEPYLHAIVTANRQLPKGVTVHELAVALTYAQLPILAAASLLLLGFNVWVAARIAQASGLLRAPWPDLPRGLRVPRPLALVLAVSLGLCFAGGVTGLVSLVVTGSLAMAFAAQGLAVVHNVTRGKSYRLPLLIIVYLSLVVFMPWLLAVYTIIGLADAGFALRRSRTATPDRPTP